MKTRAKNEGKLILLSYLRAFDFGNVLSLVSVCLSRCLNTTAICVAQLHALDLMFRRWISAYFPFRLFTSELCSATQARTSAFTNRRFDWMRT